jgi:hypothetical protein
MGLWVSMKDLPGMGYGQPQQQDRGPKVVSGEEEFLATPLGIVGHPTQKGWKSQWGSQS